MLGVRLLLYWVCVMFIWQVDDIYIFGDGVDEQARAAVAQQEEGVRGGGTFACNEGVRGRGEWLRQALCQSNHHLT